METVKTIDEKSARAVFIPTGGSETDLAAAAYLASLSDSSPDAKLLGELAMRKVGLLLIPEDVRPVEPKSGEHLCGVDLAVHKIRIGTLEAIEGWLGKVGGRFHEHLHEIVAQITWAGDLAVVVACESGDLGVISLRKARAGGP